MENKPFIAEIAEPVTVKGPGRDPVTGVVVIKILSAS
ncbi:hypothetical protein SAMN05421869_115199 [Nonomuraea jiangxiensis]|uniref:Uncharacterized protein n=1 Tax=Nonomuraea jiangxiensis TaxID=633440 RepID=A0A1G9B9K3_9ACTN|nr:hypothetical protein SAMN05421869_115199 [Nonomuraea jiangxiensis]